MKPFIIYFFSDHNKYGDKFFFEPRAFLGEGDFELGFEKFGGILVINYKISAIMNPR